MLRRPILEAALLACALAACGRRADLVISGGMVWTGLSSGGPQPGAVAIRGRTILAVGDSAAGAEKRGARNPTPRGGRGPGLPGVVGGHTPFFHRGFPLRSLRLRSAAA